MGKPMTATSANASAAGPVRLVVFADDWAGHPSSCQHLVGRLLMHMPTLWVNTIGTRPPRLSRDDFARIASRLGRWLSEFTHHHADDAPADLMVVSPMMWPGFRRDWQRRFNAATVSHTVNRALGPRAAGERRIAVTTLPITADLVGRLDVDRWVYYCVDDFSVWPGLDGPVMLDMERKLAANVDAVVAASDNLARRLSDARTDPTLLTHGIDLDHWQRNTAAHLPFDIQGWTKPVVMFWGLIDARLDITWCRALADAMPHGSLVFVGPTQSPDPALAQLPRTIMTGPVSYGELPTLAAAADVLVMPYADLPVTRAMQPLKFKEYLATGKPVVARDLPATLPWGDAADLVNSAEAFVAAVMQRIAGGLPEEQRIARERLAHESWDAKAKAFARLLTAA